MQIKLADFSHKQELFELWQEAFGNEDSDDFIWSFLNGYLIPEYNAPVVFADGKIVSALYLIEFELYSNMQIIGNCAYLFAAATRRQYRGRGYMSALIEYAAGLYKKRGISAIFVFPQEDSGNLFDFYEKFGFKSIYQIKVKKMPAQKNMRTDIDLTGLRLVNHAVNDEKIFDGLYKSYAEFTAKQNLSPMKDRLFYFKCASSYLDSPGRYFAVFERISDNNRDNSDNNNVEKFCYVFYKKFENNYYIDDIIMSEYNNMRESAQRKFEDVSQLLAEFILNNSDGARLEMNAPPENFTDKDNIKTAMILSLSEKAGSIIKNLKSPVYLNMFMNI